VDVAGILVSVGVGEQGLLLVISMPSNSALFTDAVPMTVMAPPVTVTAKVCVSAMNSPPVSA
jgi:hypothetical protein